jgi:hypothetical protein
MGAAYSEVGMQVVARAFGGRLREMGKRYEAEMHISSLLAKVNKLITTYSSNFVYTLTLQV